jgi:osmotically-inducible protein OsmY
VKAERVAPAVRREGHRERPAHTSEHVRAYRHGIAQAAVTALKWNTMVPADRITVTVREGWLTLNGTLDWQYQRDAAARAVRDLTGVKGVTNAIVVKPHLSTMDVRDKIEAAFKRSAEIDARRINIPRRIAR